MKLLQFLQDLFATGQVILPDKFYEVVEEEKAAVVAFLEDFHRQDSLEMPLKAPAFRAEAAFWGAEYIFKSLQFMINRSLNVELIPIHLKPFDQAIDPEAAYSADLCLRYLPSIYHWSKVISDDDPLLENLQETAKSWPFSCLGIPGIEKEQVPEHPSLRIAFADRIIASQTLDLALRSDQKGLIQAALGPLASKIWPKFEAFKEIQQ